MKPSIRQIEQECLQSLVKSQKRRFVEEMRLVPRGGFVVWLLQGLILALVFWMLMGTVPAAANHAWQPMPGAPNAQVSGDATDPLIAEYIAVAQEFWGAAPTCPGEGEGAAPIAFHFVLYSDESDVATGRATKCTGWLNGRDWWPNAPRSEGWCAAIAHEVGHGVHGPGHSTDPSAVMYSSTDSGQRWNWEGSVPGCARFNPLVAAPEPAPAPAPVLHLTPKQRRCRALRDRIHFAFRRAVRVQLKARYRRSCRIAAARRDL